MACEGKKGQVITTGGILRKPSGENLTLRQALDEVAKCCGQDCCNNVIRITDNVTGDLMELSVESGALVINNVTNPE